MKNFLKLALVAVYLLAGVALPTFVSSPAHAAHAAIAQDEGGDGGGEGGGDEGGEGGGGEEGGGESGGGGEEGGGD